MGHGIFPNYGPSYQKTVYCLLSKEEKKAVFFPEKKSKKSFNKPISEDEEKSIVNSKGKKR